MLAYGRYTLALLAIGLLLLAPGLAGAGDLGDQIQAFKTVFRPLDAGDLAAARADLDSAAADLEARLARAGDSAESWRVYLDTPALEVELTKPDGPDLAKLTLTYGKLTAGHEGLNLIQFAGLRDAIRRYVSVARGIDDTNVQKQYGMICDALAATMDSYRKAPNGQDATKIAARLKWLGDARQAPELIERVRAASLERNFQATVSEGLINAAMGQDVDETLPVRDVILGTRISGTGHMLGKVSVELVPSRDRAAIMTVLSGTTISDTVGYNGPVIIWADGTTHIDVRKQILIDGEGLSTLPAVADASTVSRIRSICARNGMKMIERIAWKRAGRQKCQADWIASRHAECQAGNRLDEEVDSLVGPANEDIQTKLRKPLLERGLFPAEVNYSTSEDALSLSFLQAGAFDLAAATPAPAPMAGADLSVRIHESMVNNFTSAALGGMILREERVQEAVTNMLGELPMELESEEGSEPWGITFQASRPVWVAFGDNQFTVSIRGARFYEGKTAHPGMDITVTYKIVGEGDDMQAVRQGDVAIFPPGFDPEGGKQLSAKDTVIRRILQRRLGKLFEETIVPQGMELPQDWRRAGEMKLVEFSAQDGWLAVSWQRLDQLVPEDKIKVAAAR